MPLTISRCTNTSRVISCYTILRAKKKKNCPVILSTGTKTHLLDFSLHHPIRHVHLVARGVHAVAAARFHTSLADRHDLGSYHYHNIRLAAVAYVAAFERVFVRVAFAAIELEFFCIFFNSHAQRETESGSKTFLNSFVSM